MNKSKSPRVRQFIDGIEMSDPEKFAILMTLRDIVFSHNKKIQERVMYGGIMFSSGVDFGGLFVRNNHLSFEFGLGARMKDPDGVLEGTGKFRRHLKIRSLQDIDSKNVLSFVEQALKAF